MIIYNYALIIYNKRAVLSIRGRRGAPSLPREAMPGYWHMVLGRYRFCVTLWTIRLVGGKLGVRPARRAWEAARTPVATISEKEPLP